MRAPAGWGSPLAPRRWRMSPARPAALGGARAKGATFWSAGHCRAALVRSHPMNTHAQMLRALAQVRRHRDRACVALGHVPDPQEDKAREARQAKVRASVRRAVADQRDLERHAAQATSHDQVLRVPDVMKITGLGRTTLWQLERAGRFPKRLRLTGRAVGWRASDVARWIAECYSIRQVERG
jgi:predicted DNA-binding transcriptional regulator AlpA